MRHKPTAEQKAAAAQKRAALSARCFPLHMARKGGLLPYAELLTINECLIYDYTAETGQSEWHTFKQWREAGSPVKKGEKGFPIWGRPIGAKPGQDAEPTIEDMAASEENETKQGRSFFPLAYLFHAGQTERQGGNTPIESAEKGDAQ